MSGPQPWKPRSGPHSAARNGMPGFDGNGGFDFAVGSVRGYRWWSLAEPDRRKPYEDWPVRLLTGASSHDWPDGWNEAKCNRISSHQPPVEYDEKHNIVCGCGFWAYWTETAHHLNTTMPVLGVIEGAGRTVIGEKGFRCQRARIIALYISFSFEPDIQAFRRWREHPADLRTEGGARTFESITGRHYDLESRFSQMHEPRLTGEEEQAARTLAEAWNGYVYDRLQMMYPGAEVFAVKKAMMAKYPSVGAP